MFGFACSRCWERNCSCTPKELEEHRNTYIKVGNGHLSFSSTLPKVTIGDIVTNATSGEIREGNFDEYIVEDFDDMDVPLIKNIRDVEDVKQLREPYNIICHSVKLPYSGKIIENE